jgi:hypothetical protein
MIVWIWDASGPAADACGVTGTDEAARRAAGRLLASGQASTARVELATVVVGRSLTPYYRPAGRAWDGRMEPGGPVWVPVPRRPERAAS